MTFFRIISFFKIRNSMAVCPFRFVLRPSYRIIIKQKLNVPPSEKTLIRHRIHVQDPGYISYTGWVFLVLSFGIFFGSV